MGNRAWAVLDRLYLGMRFSFNFVICFQAFLSQTTELYQATLRTSVTENQRECEFRFRRLTCSVSRVQWQGLRAVGNGFIANYSPPAQRTENLAIAQVRGHYIQFAATVARSLCTDSVSRIPIGS